MSVISGALVQVIAGINFYLYGRTQSQASEFLNRLDQTQRFWLANSVCEGLEGDSKQKARSELVSAIAQSPRSGEQAIANVTQHHGRPPSIGPASPVVRPDPGPVVH